MKVRVSPTAVHLSSRQPVAHLVERHFVAEIGRKNDGGAKQRDSAICSKRKGSGWNYIQIMTVQSPYVCGAMFRAAPQKEKP